MTDHDLSDLQDLMRQLLREFDWSGPWPSLDVLIDGEVHTAIVGVELGELLERIQETVNDYE